MRGPPLKKQGPESCMVTLPFEDVYWGESPIDILK